MPNQVTAFLEAYQHIRSESIQICQPLATEDYVVQPTLDVSPPKWHLAHTTWFFETFVLAEYYKKYKVFNEDYSFLFNSYYESAGARTFRGHRGNMTRPIVEDIMRYRLYVDAHMEELIQQRKRLQGKLKFLIELGLQHEQQHQELLRTDIKYILGHNPLFPVYTDTPEVQPIASPYSDTFLSIKSGVYSVGHKGKGFHFDNEAGAHKVYLHAFEIQERLITNGEYIEFINAGGYTQFEHWLAEGWDWVNKHEIQAPLYWHKEGRTWYRYGRSGYKKVDAQEPVMHLSYYEANAFAAWKGLRLPTEFEWEVASKQLNYGQLWEWTQSAYLPYPFFKKAAGAVGEYNGKFMVNQMVLRGGSLASPEGHIRPTYRNFFHPDKRWQYTGLRLVREVPK